MNKMNRIQYSNWLDSFFRHDSNLCVAVVARTTGVAREFRARGRHGSDTDCGQLNNKAGPRIWMCNEMNLRVLMSIGLLKRELTKSAATILQLVIHIMKELKIEEMTSLRGGVLDFSNSLNDSNIALVLSTGNTASSVAI